MRIANKLTNKTKSYVLEKSHAKRSCFPAVIYKSKH